MVILAPAVLSTPSAHLPGRHTFIPTRRLIHRFPSAVTEVRAPIFFGGGGNNTDRMVFCAPSVGRTFYIFLLPKETSSLPPRLSSQHESLCAPLHLQLIVFIPQPCALCRVHMLLLFQRVTSLSLVLRRCRCCCCCVTCVMRPWRGLPAAFYLSL